MKKGELCAQKCWGFLIAAFGAFFLIANLVPSREMLCYWPIFLISAGLLKAYCGGMCHRK